MHDGRSGDIDLMLWPVNFTLAYAGFTVLEPFVAYGVEAGLQYSDPAVIKARLKGVVEEFRANLQDLDRRRPSGALMAGSCRMLRCTPPSSVESSTLTWSERKALSHLARRDSIAAPYRLSKPLNLLNPSPTVR